MTTDRRPNVDPVVYEEMARAEAAGADATVSVVLVLAIPDEGATPRDLADLERRQQPVVERLRARLAELGVAGPGTPLPLAGGLAVDLTPAQVEALAADPLVKRIVSNRQVRAIP
ncbi:MAG: hypothetical protein KJ066_17860 [Acidobacteria bacterium]|nr:hypothetical protein [Acidobacteriota bacterium]